MANTSYVPAGQINPMNLDAGLKKAVEQYNKSLKTANKSLKRFGQTHKAVKASTKGLTAATQSATVAANKNAAAMNSAGINAVALIATYSILTSAIEGIMAPFLKQERAEAILNQTLLATGEAAGFTTKELKKMAKEMQNATTFGDEEILSSMAKLASFVEITGGEFIEAEKAAQDLAILMGTDLKEATLQLAKALNDPISTLGALKRSGVSFDKAQAKMIKSLWAAGRQAEAQTVLLKLLKDQGIDGTAEAIRDTLGGALDANKNSFGDFMESVGGAIAVMLGIRGVTEDNVSAWSELSSMIEAGMPYFKLIGEVIDVVRQTMQSWIASIFAANGALIEFFRTLWKVKDIKTAWKNAANIFDKGVGGAMNRVQKEATEMIDAFKNFGKVEDENTKKAKKNDKANKDLNNTLKARMNIFSGYDKISRAFQQDSFKDLLTKQDSASNIEPISTFTDALAGAGGGKDGKTIDTSKLLDTQMKQYKEQQKTNESGAETNKILGQIKNGISKNRLIFAT